MTNYEYIINNLTERNLTELFINGSMFYKEKFNESVQIAFRNWMKNNDKTGRNYEKNYKDIKKNHSIFGSYEKIYNEETDKWITYGRTRNLKFQLWLSLQYNKKEWKD